MLDRSSPPRFAPRSVGRLAHALGLILFYYALLAVSHAACARLLPGEDLFEGGPHVVAAALALGVLQLVLVVHLGLVRIGRISYRGLGWKLDTPARDVVAGLLGFALWVIVESGLVLAFGRDLSEVVRDIASFTPGQRAVGVLVGIAAAITEESVYRGYLQSTLVAWLRFPLGIVAGAIIFTLMHRQLDGFHITSKIFTALLFSSLRGRDASLVRPGIVHFLQWAVVGMA